MKILSQGEIGIRCRYCDGDNQGTGQGGNDEGDVHRERRGWGSQVHLVERYGDL